MIFADQSKERTILCLKRRDSDVDCSNWLPTSRIPVSEITWRASKHDTSSHEDSSVYKRSPRRSRSIRNNDFQLSRTWPHEQNPATTGSHKLNLYLNQRQQTLPSLEVEISRQHIIQYCSHEQPPFHDCFAWLHSPPFHLYRTVAFNKRHLFYLEITRMFCDLTKTVLQRPSSLSQSRVIWKSKSLHASLPPAARLCSHHPFRSNSTDRKAGISATIRRLTALFLWVCILGVVDVLADQDHLLYTVMSSDVINHFMSWPRFHTQSSISAWQK